MIAQPENVLLVNHASGSVRVYPSRERMQVNEKSPVQEVVGHDDEPLWRELDSFLTCIQQNTTPLVSGRDGLAALQLAHHVVRDIQSRYPQEIALPSDLLTPIAAEALPVVSPG